MTPYGSFLFFFIVGILLLPTMVLGLMGKNLRYYNAFVSIAVLALIFSDSLSGFLSLIAFAIFQVLLIKGYIAYRKEHNNSLVFYIFSFLSILPLLLSKVLPFFEVDNLVGFLGISYVTFRAVYFASEI